MQSLTRGVKPRFLILYTVDDDVQIVVIYRIKAKSESTYKFT